MRKNIILHVRTEKTPQVWTIVYVLMPCERSLFYENSSKLTFSNAALLQKLYANVFVLFWNGKLLMPSSEKGDICVSLLVMSNMKCQTFDPGNERLFQTICSSQCFQVHKTLWMCFCPYQRKSKWLTRTKCKVIWTHQVSVVCCTLSLEVSVSPVS